MFASVLVGTDGSSRAERAVEAAVELAKSQGARLCLVAAFADAKAHGEPIQSTARVDVGHLESVAEQVLMRAGRRAEEKGVEVDWESRPGDPAEVILDIAKERGADLIVVGNKGMSGARRYLLGNVPNKITHHAPCSVMVVRTD